MKANKKDVGENFKKPFPTILRKLLDEKNISQAKLAEIIGVERQAISYYTLGVTLPNIEKLEKMADYFEVTTEYLLGRSPYKTSENDAIGKELKLSDGAIQTLKNATFDVNTVSEIIESEYFAKMIELISDYLVCDDNITLFGSETFESSLPSYKSYIISKYIGYILYNIRVERKYDKTGALKRFKLSPEVLKKLKSFEEFSDKIKKQLNQMGEK